MIIREQPRFVELLYTMRGSIIPRILPHLVLTAAFACVIVALHRVAPAWMPSLTGLPLALVGIAISIFLGFRNNACYERWWEARRQWGELISVCRTFARQSAVLEDGSDAARKIRHDLVVDTAHFVHRFVTHIRPEAPSLPGRPLFDPVDRTDLAGRDNPPEAILLGISERLALLRRTGVIGDVIFQTLDRSVASMGGVLAACERIRNTPLPYAYTLLLHRTAYLFCFLFPLCFVDTLGWFTPFATVLVAYTFFGLDALSVELEKPFSHHQNSMPLTSMARIIEISLAEAIGETTGPRLQPVNHVLD